MHNRHSIRLRGYDYSQNGLYFVTVCTFQRENLLGEIKNGQMQINVFGEIVNSIWVTLNQRFGIGLDTFQIMPNHIHMIIQIVGAIHESPLRRPLLSQIIGYFKMNTSKMTNHHLWQRNYYEHIIRDENEYFAICRYIIDNPKNWDKDEDNVG